MSPKRAAKSKPKRKRIAADHIHLPSVHIRAHNGVGLNYEENFFHRGGRWERVIRLEILRGNAPALVRETFDVLCTQELAGLHEVLPILMDKRNPAAKPIMEEAARREFERQVRIAGGQEIACVNCGCSETRSCSGGCCWATETLCSRCV